jgi:sensor c-di-GMP phosphodiesterase-like protein
VQLGGRWLPALVVGGVLLAAIPMYALDRAFDAYMTNKAAERLDVQASAALTLAEARLDHAASVLTRLAATGIEECGPPALEAMRLAVFTSTPLKGLSILDDQGRELCTHLGALLDAYAVAEEYPIAGKNFSLAAARFRDLNERAVRLRLERASGRSLAALIAIDALLPGLELDRDGGGRRLLFQFASGETIAVRPNGGEDRDFAQGAAVTVRKASESFPIVMHAEFARTALAAEFAGLQLIARIAMLVLLAFGAAMLWMAIRRNGQDPVAELKRAMREGEIIPYYQPTVDLKTGRVRGAEVLARWRRRDGTVVSPAHFIPLAEQTGLIYELTRVLMRRALEEVGPSYRDRPRLRLAFNLFAGHFTDGSIVEDIEKIFAGEPIGLNQIVLEVTERAPLPDLDEARRVIESLQGRGIRIAIDDVGTGHGGLSYLMKLGVDIIKIDKMFVDAIGTERYSQTIIETLVELGRTMKMEVIAEGVESVEQVEYLRLKGVTEAQGYVFAPPLPTNSYLTLVEAMERPRLSTVPAQAVLAGAA